MKVVCLFLFFTVCLASDMKVNFNPNSDAAKEHLKEDLEGVIQKNPDEMSMEEMQFHYFREHDYNNDKMLDGNELTRKLMQQLDRSPTTTEVDKEKVVMAAVEEALHSFDLDGDGLIQLHEYQIGGLSGH